MNDRRARCDIPRVWNKTWSRVKPPTIANKDPLTVLDARHFPSSILVDKKLISHFPSHFAKLAHHEWKETGRHPLLSSRNIPICLISSIHNFETVPY